RRSSDLRYRRQDAERCTTRESAGDFGGAQDRGVLGTVHKVATRVARGASADPTRIEVARPVAAQQLAAFGEKWPLLVKEDLERRQIHDRRIRLDLSEVGIHRCVERDVGTEAHFQVGTGSAAEIRAAMKWISG